MSNGKPNLEDSVAVDDVSSGTPDVKDSVVVDPSKPITIDKPQDKTISGPEAFTRHFLQALTLGKGPQLEAATQFSAMVDPARDRLPYGEYRDLTQQALKTTEEESPIWSGTGEVFGSILPTMAVTSVGGPIAGMVANPYTRPLVKPAIDAGVSFMEGYNRPPQEDPTITDRVKSGATWAAMDITGSKLFDTVGSKLKNILIKKKAADPAKQMHRVKRKLYSMFGINMDVAKKYEKAISKTKEGAAIKRVDDLIDFVVNNEDAAYAIFKKDPAEFAMRLKNIKDTTGGDIGRFYKAISEEGVEAFTPESLIAKLQDDVLEKSRTLGLNRQEMKQVDDVIKELQLMSDLNATQKATLEQLGPQDPRTAQRVWGNVPVDQIREGDLAYGRKMNEATRIARDVDVPYEAMGREIATPEKMTPEEAHTFLQGVDQQINYEKLDIRNSLGKVKEAREIARQTLYDAISANAGASKLSEIKKLNNKYRKLAPIEFIAETLYKTEKKMTKEGIDAVAMNVPTQAWSINYMMQNKLPTAGSKILNKIFEPNTPTKSLKSAAKHYKKYIKAVNWNRVTGGEYYRSIMESAMGNLDDRARAAAMIGTHMDLYNRDSNYRAMMDFLANRREITEDIPYSSIKSPDKEMRLKSWADKKRKEKDSEARY